MSTTYLITGATGATGSQAVAALLANGETVRALVRIEDARADSLRIKGAEVVVADLMDFDETRRALDGVQRAYFVWPVAPGIVQATTQFAEGCREAGVEAIVNMSQKPARAAGSQSRVAAALACRARVRLVRCTRNPSCTPLSSRNGSFIWLP